MRHLASAAVLLLLVTILAACQDEPVPTDAEEFAAANAESAGVPSFTPHDLRHRRISLLHRQGSTWAEIARFVGQRKLSITADTYTHVLSDGREADYAELLAA